MTYTLRFLPEVEDDVIAGYAWYEEKAPALGEEFLRILDKEIVVFGFFHCARDPRTIRAKLRART